MNKKSSYLRSPEVLTGVAMVAVGLGLMAAGVHGAVAEALAPFGVGLILSDGIGRAAKAASERLKVRVRRDKD